MPNQMWLIKHPKSDSIFVVEYGLVNGKLTIISQGFTKGNVVSLDLYRRVRKQAQQMFAA